jgi:GTP-binding protein
MFVDQVTIFVQSGDGGRGCVSFRREKYVPRGGPDGGDGGRGGDVVLVAERGLSTLAELRYRKRYVAAKGADGAGARKTGHSEPPLEVRVPAGTAVWDQDTGEQIADLTQDGQRLVVAQGGKGGLGNQHFATPTRQAPRYAQPGLPGESRWLRLELKLLADVGLVGFPNAGKSTLISRVSSAHPKVADYPFTTLIPHLGVVNWGDYRAFVLADIPGLIEGAHAGKGLGDRFLRHVERTRYLVLMADVTALAEPVPPEALTVLRRELAAHQPDLSGRPFCVAATKLDAADPDALAAARAWADAHGVPCFPISAVSGEGVDALVHHLGETVDRLRAQEQAQARAEARARAPEEAEEARQAAARYREIWGEDV